MSERRFALICYHDSGKPSVEVTYWPTRAQAIQAEAELAPCGPRCIGVHTVVNVDPPPRHPAALALSRNRHGNNASGGRHSRSVRPGECTPGVYCAHHSANQRN
jgi:hypothetical protein